MDGCGVIDGSVLETSESNKVMHHFQSCRGGGKHALLSSSTNAIVFWLTCEASEGFRTSCLSFGSTGSLT